MPQERPHIPARDSGLSLSSNLSKKRSHGSSRIGSGNASSYISLVGASRLPSLSSSHTPSHTPSCNSLSATSRDASYSSLETLRSPSYSSFTTATSVTGSVVGLSQPTAYSANVTPPLPPLGYKMPVKDSHEYAEQPLTYGQLVALLWPDYGQDSYAEARRQYLAQAELQRKERSRKVKKTKSLWSLLSREG